MVVLDHMGTALNTDAHPPGIAYGIVTDQLLPSGKPYGGTAVASQKINIKDLAVDHSIAFPRQENPVPVRTIYPAIPYCIVFSPEDNPRMFPYAVSSIQAETPAEMADLSPLYQASHCI